MCNKYVIVLCVDGLKGSRVLFYENIALSECLMTNIALIICHSTLTLCCIQACGQCFK